ncbi:hypothetical protein QUA54_09345 [Microcoleus sp. MOSTC5]
MSQPTAPMQLRRLLESVPLALKLCHYQHLTFAGSKRVRLVVR